MVKNQKGGKGAKSLARKSQNSNSYADELQLASCEEEQYCCVTNMYGNGMCEVYTNENIKLICHIRNKFRGRQKRNNMVTKNSIVLVGLRDYENPPKNCDLLCIYDDNHVEQLKNIPQINIRNILQIRMNNQINAAKDEMQNDTNIVLFTNDVEEEIYENNNNLCEFTLDRVDEINIDDI